MTLILSADQMRAADRRAIDELAIPSLVLMENAGRGTTALIVALHGGDVAGLAVRVVCGAGSNGGDGFVVARHLANAGADVRVLLAAPRERVRGDAAVFLRALDAMRVEVEDGTVLGGAAGWGARLADAEVVVDALLGTGLENDVRGVAADAIAAMNGAPGLKVAVDVPSGLDADTGRPHGACFRADVTATMGCRKLGLVVDPDAPVGRVEVVDLGALMAPPESSDLCFWLEEDEVLSTLPRRRPSAHKGDAGHLLIIAGSPGKTGAALLAARAAMRSGAGLVTVASTAAGQAALDAKLVEVMSVRYAEGEDAELGSYSAIEKLAERMKAVAIGPGIPPGPGMERLVRELAGRLPLPMVLDADGLNLLGTDAGRLLSPAPAPRILTPHPGEMARLLGTSIAEVQADRLGAARQLAAVTGAIAVLKGARTIIATPDGEAFVNPAVSPELATAGSGDVLTGITAALLAQGMEALDAACAAVMLHGLTGAVAAKRLGGPGVTAGDLVEAIPTVRKQAEEGEEPHEGCSGGGHGGCGGGCGGGHGCHCG